MKQFSCLLILLLIIHASSTPDSTTRRHYIVYMGKHSFLNTKTVMSSNLALLGSVVGSVHAARNATVHHYHRSFRGFSAMLTPKQAEQIAKSSSVISVFESKLLQLHTSRSWDFMGATFNSTYTQVSTNQEYKYDVIVGHFDGGVWPESHSFSPNGLGPVPKRFRGKCESGDQFSPANCNSKIIGARYYTKGFEADYGPLDDRAANGELLFRSPRDDVGHGSHTASTAVGAVVANATVAEMGTTNTVRGGAPRARLAVYKVCWFDQCSCADTLKATDDAIADNVDIITVSLGSEEFRFWEDCFGIAAFHAFQNGILVSASGGNGGEKGPSTISNGSPWVITVGASTTDRRIISDVHLGNSKTLRGFALNNFPLKGHHELIVAGSCRKRSLDADRIRGKIVVCTLGNQDEDTVVKSQIVGEAGGVGMILVGSELDKSSIGHAIPTSLIGREEAEELEAYLRTARQPVATISNSRFVLNHKPAPEMASFSSRGPSTYTPELIKPDITAPGVDIVAAFPPDPDQKPDELIYRLESGTSMSCPHVAGVAAVIKALHHDWSPAEIKSALMTTASQLDNTGKPIRLGSTAATPFELGSGHLNPNAALNPGLVYDLNAEDMVLYLCSHGVNASDLKNLVGERVRCPDPPVAASNMNYPSIGIDNVVSSISVLRTVTYRGNCGDPKVFKVSIEHPEGIRLEVKPNTLDFSNGQNKISFRVNVVVKQPLRRFVFGSLTWFNDVHRVRSPIAIRAIK